MKRKKDNKSFVIIEFGEMDIKEYEKTKKQCDVITEDIYNPNLFYEEIADIIAELFRHFFYFEYHDNQLHSSLL